MKKILLFFAAMICAAAGWAQEATVSAIAKSNVLEVSLTNETEKFVAFQMDITLPDGVTVDSEDAIEVNLARLDENSEVPFVGAPNSNFNVAYNVIDAKTVRVISYNLKNRAIVGKEGLLFTMSFNGAAASDFNLSNIKFVTETELLESELTPVVSVPGASYEVGDVNMDHAVSLLDLTRLINILVGASEKTETSDVNGDTFVTLLDLTRLINILVGK